MVGNELEKRKKVIAHFLENPNSSGRSIAKSLQLVPQTVNKIIKRYKETLEIERKNGSGGCRKQMSREVRRKVIVSLKQNPRLSDQDRAKRYGISKSTSRNVRVKAGYRSYRVIKHPNRSDKQSKVAKNRARSLYDTVLTKFNGCILMDDETYVKCDYKQIPGHQYYVSTIRGNVPDKFKYVCQDKFAKKIMVWQAICSCGLKSKPFLTSSTMNADLYIKECLQKRILPMIQSHNVPVKFWPDLASCHYATSTKNWYIANNVDFVEKHLNPPNSPELRPIEIYWAIMKRKLLKSGGACLSIEDMRRKWINHSKTVSSDLVQRLMSSIKKKTRAMFRS